MTSFIDLMANDVWSETDIKSRLHAEIRSEVSEMAEQELNRALQGKMLGMHVMSQAEIALLMAFKAATDRAAVLGTAARADMALLNKVLVLEPAQRRLALEPVEPVLDELEAIANVLELDRDALEREEAQVIIDAASADALALSLLRNPVPEPEEEEAEEVTL